jgi:hypothetical protein
LIAIFCGGAASAATAINSDKRKATAPRMRKTLEL